MGKKLDGLKIANEIAIEKGGRCLSKEYVTSQTKMKWECRCGHIWDAILRDIYHKNSWCPQCAKTIRADKIRLKNGLEVAQSLAKEKDGECLSTKYVSSQKKMRWKCKYGHMWKAPLVSISSSNHWCPECSIKTRASKTRLKNGLDIAHSLAKSKNGKCLSDLYYNINDKLKWKCSAGHTWSASLQHIKNSGSWCRKCASRERGQKRLLNDGLEEAKKIAIGKGGICLSAQYFGVKYNLEWQCIKGHKWQANLNRIKSGSWCYNCSKNKKYKLNECKNIAIEKGGELLSNEYINSKNMMLWKCEKKHKWLASLNSINSGYWCPDCGRLKGSKKMNNSYTLRHWKTNEEIICIGSYEKATVEYLNTNKINFRWQPRYFNMPDGKKYYPDLYIFSIKKWVEIKGYKREKNMKKWDWFKTIKPNSELWDKDKLKEMRIL